MSSNFMYSLSDGNPDLQKQIGCMNGLFHLFDCHHFYGSRRRVAGPNPKKLPSGQNGKFGTKAKIGSGKIKGNNLKKAVKEKQRFSFDSSRTSFSSSSCSSSFSPADCSKESQADRSSQTAFHETPRKEISSYLSNASLESSQNSIDLRNMVKELIYREARGLSIKTGTKVEAGQHQTLRYIDSPRPLQSPKPSTARSTSINESSHALLKLKEVPKMSNQCEYGPLSFAPRFSYDGRGTKDAHKVNPKDLSRLSLDSRESSINGSINSTNVVAKLMGVEALVNPILNNGNQSRQIKSGHDLKDVPLSPSSGVDENKKSLMSGCSRNSGTEPRSPCMTNIAESKKPVVTRCPIEPAPWRQVDGIKGGLKCGETLMKSPNSFRTVYGEIEKRLAELEFIESGKELGACKRILEAMQKSKQMSENQKGEQASGIMSHTNSIKGSGSPTCLKSPIKIMKPAKVTENASISTSTVVATSSLSRLRTSSYVDTINEKVNKRSYHDLTPRPTTPRDLSSRLHSSDKSRISKESSPTALENPKMGMSSETTCPKLHQKKLEVEKKSRRTGPASDQSKSRRQSSSLQADSGSPHRKLKSPKLRQSDDQLNDISSEMRDLSRQGDDSLMLSESNMSMASYGDTEVTTAQKQEKKQKNTAARFSEGNSKTEPPRTALEQPSPVSVLDATFYGDGSPSPVKKKSHAFEGDEGLTPNDEDWSSIGVNHSLTCRETSPRFINLDSINEIDHICNSPNPDHEYIADVMSASGLLSEFDFMAYQLHPSGHLINPNLFPALEQIKASIRFLKVNQLDPIVKNHRQLIFDVVNEILIMKSLKKGSYKQWILPSSPDNRRRKRQQLVRDLCSEIDKLQTTSNIEDNNNLNSILWGDLTLESMDWTERRREIPWLVLDVERLIFKDLICEVINGEAAANLHLQQQQRPRHCRRLFSN